MTRAVIMAAALGAFLGGCTKVPDLDPGNCGNRVVEDDEDCDGFASPGLECGAPSTDNQCSFVCNPDDPAPACPTNWHCGRDARCRQPTGIFDVERTTTLQFSTEALAVGDVDGNGYIDIVGNQSSRVSMLLGSGSPTEFFSDERDVLAPEPVAPLLFDYVDDDKRLDVIVPISSGLFTLVGDARTSLEPVPYASLQLNPLGGIRALAVESFDKNGDDDREFLALTNDGMVFFEADSTSAQSYPDQGSLGDLGRDVAVGDIDEDGLDEVALAFDKEQVVHICRGQVDASDLEGSLQAVCGATVAVTNPVNAAGGTRFADVNGDGHLDLLVSVTENNVMQVEVALNDKAALGTFSRSEVADIFSTGGGVAARANPWPLAVVDLDGELQGDPAADYVLSKDVLVVNAELDETVPTSGVVAARAGADTWTSAAITDINGDKRVDVAVSLDQLDGIDFFRNVADDPDSGVVFNPVRVDTDGPPRLLRSGDFDGDQVGDVAVVLGELDDDQPNQIAASFGNTSGAPSDPLQMGTFGRVDVLEPIDTSLGVDDFDSITDLAVIFSTTTPLARLANVLRGDSSRRMLSPFFLFTSDEVFDAPQGVALGSFGSLGAGSPTALDLLVIGKHATGFRAWLLAGTGTGGGLSAFEQQADLPASAELDYGCALWRAGDLDGNPGDEIVGIDSRSGCASAGETASILQMKIDPGAFDRSGSASLEPVITDLGPDFVNVRALHLEDMDLDGYLDIVVAFQGDERSSTSTSKAVIFWNDGGSFDLQNNRAVIESPPFVFYDAAPIRFDTAAPELLLLSEGEVNGETRRLILRVGLQPGTRTY
ncbi:MAG TPA: hypothetical protein VNM90_06150, partial [Haliangium sp.]|nr:hypothetical protein [Haliangium sp.]